MTHTSTSSQSSSSTHRAPLWRAREDFWFADGDVLIVAGSGGRIAFWDWDSWNKSPRSTDAEDVQFDDQTLGEDNIKARARSSRIDASASFLVHSAVLNRAGSSTFCSRLKEGRIPPSPSPPPDSDSGSDEDKGDEESDEVNDDEGDGETSSASDGDAVSEDAQDSPEADDGYGDLDFSESETWEQEAGLPEEEDLVEVIRASDDRYDIECLLHALYFGIDPNCSYSFLDAVLRISRKYNMNALYAAGRRQMNVLYGSSTAPLMVYDPLDQWEKGIFDAFSTGEEKGDAKAQETDTKSKPNVLSIPIDTPPLLHRQSSHDTPQPMVLPAPIAFY